jgi:trehalose-phosphatase
MTGPYRAVILDLDGVITQTAGLHAQAWKRMFDAFLAAREARAGEDLSPFDIGADYHRYVDGKPRYDGAQSFLAARGIDLTEDEVRSLGDRKDKLFHVLLHEQGARVFDDAVAQIEAWRERGLRTAVITSSRNGREVLELTDLLHLFDARIDGRDAARLGIRGKPEPDIFLRAAEQLGVSPAETIVVEDAIAGVQAGHAGGFGLVVGVVRNGQQSLTEYGADIEVSDLREIDDHVAGVAAGSGTAAASAATTMPGATAAPAAPADATMAADGATTAENAIEQFDRFTALLDRRRLTLFLDYDGTMTPIVPRPEDAVLSERVRRLVRELAERVTVGIISGRDLDDVRGMVQLDELYFAGSHGFDVRGPDDMRMQHEAAVELLPELDAAERELHVALRDIDGVHVERKRFALAIHYRAVDDSDLPRVEPLLEQTVDRVRAQHPRLRQRGGKKIVEIQPDVPWHKGYAVRWLLEQVEPGPDVLPVYIGDDTTDEDAFEALADTGLGIRVGDPGEPTHARMMLGDTDELAQFLEMLLGWLKQRDGRG